MSCYLTYISSLRIVLNKCYITPILRPPAHCELKQRGFWATRKNISLYRSISPATKVSERWVITGNTDIPVCHWGLNTDIPVSHWELNTIHNSSSLKFETDIPASLRGLNTDIPVSHWELNTIHNSSSLKFETDIPASLRGLNTDIPDSHWVEHRRPSLSLSWTQTAQFLIKSWKVKGASPENRLRTGLRSKIKKRF